MGGSDGILFSERYWVRIVITTAEHGGMAPVISAFGRLSQEDYEFEASWDYIPRLYHKINQVFKK
jgi:hypothetical protein